MSESRQKPELRENTTGLIGIELERNEFNGCVGRTILSETARFRIWSLTLAPGERLGFHRHVLDFHRVSLLPGRVRSVNHLGESTLEDVNPGEVRHIRLGPGEFLLHDLENVGRTRAAFLVTELLDGPNRPLEVPDHVRKKTGDVFGLGSLTSKT